jgi:hypothetical protein
MPSPESWPSLTVVNLRRSFDTLVALVRSRDTSHEPEVTAALARLLVIRTCGYLEQISEEACRAYLRSKTRPQVSAFGVSWLGRGVNPTPDHLVSLVKRFESRWGDDLQAVLDADDQLLNREIAFLVDRRNKMAHGGSENTSTAKALQLAEYANRVAEWFLVKLDPRDPG